MNPCIVYFVLLTDIHFVRWKKGHKGGATLLLLKQQIQGYIMYAPSNTVQWLCAKKTVKISMILHEKL